MLDTNVIMDVLQRREPFFQDSYSVLKLSSEGRVVGCVSASMITDIFYLLRHALKDTQRAKDAVETLLHLVYVEAALPDDVYAAIASNMSDFEDAFVASIAQRCGMDYIVTRNTKDFTDSPVRAVTPTDFLRLV